LRSSPSAPPAIFRCTAEPLAFDVLSDRLQQKIMWKIVKQPFDVEFEDPIILPAPLTRCSDGVQSRLSRPVTVGVRKKERIQIRLDHLLDHHLRDPVADRGHT